MLRASRPCVKQSDPACQNVSIQTTELLTLTLISFCLHKLAQLPHGPLPHHPKACCLSLLTGPTTFLDTCTQHFSIKKRFRQ